MISIIIMGRQEEVVKERLKKLEKLKRNKINPYLSKYSVKDISSELHEKYSKLKKGEKTKLSASVSGRIMSIRDMGKIIFATIYDGFGNIQIILQKEETPEKMIELFREYIDSGDFLSAEGSIFRTERGELSILINKVVLLTKSIFPLPEKWHGIQHN